MKNLFILIGISLMLSSCAFQLGTMTGNAALSNSEFQVVDFGIGTSSTTKILGFGGIKKESLVLEAKRDLYTHYPLKRGQALSNVTVDFVLKNYIFFSKLKVTVSAEIVEFDNSYDSLLGIEVSNTLKNNKPLEYKGFHVNEEIYVRSVNTYKKCKILELYPATINVKFVEDNEQKEIVKYQDAFKIKQSDEINRSKYIVNDMVNFYWQTENNKQVVLVGVIESIGYKKNYIIKFTFNGEEYTDVIHEANIFIKN